MRNLRATDREQFISLGEVIMILDYSRLRQLLRILLVPLLFAIAAPVAAQTAPESWPRWQRSGPGLEVDHGSWEKFLERNRRVGRDGIARVAYGQVSAADKAALKAYVRGLQVVNVDRMTKVQQLAYWINLYNATTVGLVVDAYPVDSIKRVQGGLLRQGPWTRKRLSIKGEAVSLDDIEHRILRPNWKDPRIHYAINCAALGCPNLAAHAFTASKANAMLDEGARAFVNHPRAFRLERGALVASSIYDWFAVDFGGPDGVVKHARRFASPATAAMLRGKSRPDRYSYDWSLNLAK